VGEVQMFIRFAKVNRRLIKAFSEVCKPITEMLKGYPKDVYWGREQEEVREELKKRFKMGAILSHFDLQRKKVVKTEVSNWVLRCVLSQFQG